MLHNKPAKLSDCDFPRLRELVGEVEVSLQFLKALELSLNSGE
jgi:hypothetical protein